MSTYRILLLEISQFIKNKPLCIQPPIGKPQTYKLNCGGFIFQDQEWRDTEIDDSDESQEELDEKVKKK